MQVEKNLYGVTRQPQAHFFGNTPPVRNIAPENFIFSRVKHETTN